MINIKNRKIKTFLYDLPYIKRWYRIQVKYSIKYHGRRFFGITNNEKRIHHHVPQVLLRNFSSKKSFIYRRDKRTFESEEISIAKEAGNIEGQFFFQNKVTHQEDQLIEDYYGELERETAPILKKIDSDVSIKFSNFENIMLANFIASLIVRNPIFREFVGLTLSNFVKNNPKFIKITPKIVHDIFIENKYNLSQTSLEEWAPTYERLKHKKLLNASMVCSFYLLQYFAKHIHFCGIDILEISNDDFESGYFFIISDNPVIISNKNFTQEIAYFPPINLENTLIILPISPTKVMTFSMFNSIGKYYINPETIKRINALSILNSPEYTYSHKDSKPLEKQFSKNE